MAKNSTRQVQTNRKGDPGKLRDLSDFCQQWPALRRTVTDDSFAALEMPDDARQVVHWLVQLADRVHQDEDG